MQGLLRPLALAVEPRLQLGELHDESFAGLGEFDDDLVAALHLAHQEVERVLGPPELMGVGGGALDDVPPSTRTQLSLLERGLGVRCPVMLGTDLERSELQLDDVGTEHGGAGDVPEGAGVIGPVELGDGPIVLGTGLLGKRGEILRAQ